MSGMMNIVGTATNEDPTYRYKMPRLVARIEGRGNGIKTVIVNMADIATAINRPAVSLYRGSDRKEYSALWAI